MAYINRLSDINNKLDKSNENQIESNEKIANIDDNIATLNTNIKNSFDSTNNALKVNIVSGGSDSNGKAYLYNGDGDTSITATALSTTKNGIDTASSLYVSDGTTRTALTSTGTALDIHIDSGAVNIKDSSGNDLNSTSNALNSYITNASIPVTGDFYQATQPISGTVGISNSFTLETTTQSTNTKLDTIHTDLDGLTFDGSSNLNVNINNGNVNINDSSGNNLNSTSNALNSYITNASIPVSISSSVAIYQADITTPLSIAGDVNIPGSVAIYQADTTTPLSIAGDVNINNGNVNISDSNGNSIISTTNYQSNVGLNTYQIAPKRKYYCCRGYTVANSVNAILNGYNGTQTLINYSITDKIWYYRFFNASPITMNLSFDYIDSNGDLVENYSQGTITSSSNTATTVQLVGGATIKHIFNFNTTSSLTAGSYLDILNGNSTTAGVGGYYYPSSGTFSYTLNLNSVFMVPNGYIAWIPQLSIVGGVNINIHIAVIKSNGNRITLNNFYYVNGTSKEVSSGNNYSGIGGVFTAGDRIFICRGDATSLAHWSSFDIIMEAI